MPLQQVVLHPFVAPEPFAREGQRPDDGDVFPLCFAEHRGDPRTTRLADTLVEEGIPLRRTGNLGETLAALGEGRHRAVLLDPLGSGPVELAATLAEAPRTPFVVLLDAERDEDALAAVEVETSQRGALIDVAHRGASAREVALRLAALQRAAAWRHRACHDERTECLRPAAFHSRLDEAFSAARRHRFPLALALLDLDDFGVVNKRYDHTTGDRVIARAGAVLRSTLRAEDQAGRIGGDEFALLLPFTDLAEGVRCCERVLAELARSPIPGAAGARVNVTASAGVASIGVDEDLPLELVRRRAELALRWSKRSGGNRATAWRDRETDESLAVAE